MGKTNESLKKLQEMRENKYGLALKKSEQAAQDCILPGKAQALKPAVWPWKATLAFSILLILGFNIAVLFTLKNYISKEKEKKAAKKITAPQKPSASKQAKSVTLKKTKSTTTTGARQPNKKH